MSDPSVNPNPGVAPATTGQEQPAVNGGAPPDSVVIDLKPREGQKQPRYSVELVQVDGTDGRGERIDYVFFRRAHYAIYECKNRIVVCYSDDEKRATEQITAIAPLIPLRDRLQYMIAGLRLPNCYREQIAEALRLGLENQMDIARRTLEGAIQDVTETQARLGRMVYLGIAGPLAMLIAFGLIVSGKFWANDQYMLVLIATGAGAIGALLSIATAIRARTVAADGDWRTNAVDATVRVLIGVTSAAALFMLLSSGVLTNINAGSVSLTGPGMTGQVAFLIGFAAGFLERLVPDLLEKSSLAASKQIGGVALPREDIARGPATRPE